MQDVECTNSIKCIAKYVNKGCDRILFQKGEGDAQINEIKNYQEARFVNANEGYMEDIKVPDTYELSACNVIRSASRE